MSTVYPVHTVDGVQWLTLAEIRARVEPPAPPTRRPNLSRFFVPTHPNFVFILFTVLVLWPVGAVLWVASTLSSAAAVYRRTHEPKA